MLAQLCDKCPAVKKAVTLIFVQLRPSSKVSKERNISYYMPWRIQFCRNVQHITDRYRFNGKRATGGGAYSQARGESWTFRHPTLARVQGNANPMIKLLVTSQDHLLASWVSEPIFKKVGLDRSLSRSLIASWRSAQVLICIYIPGTSRPPSR